MFAFARDQFVVAARVPAPETLLAGVVEPSVLEPVAPLDPHHFLRALVTEQRLVGLLRSREVGLLEAPLLDRVLVQHVVALKAHAVPVEPQAGPVEAHALHGLPLPLSELLAADLALLLPGVDRLVYAHSLQLQGAPALELFLPRVGHALRVAHVEEAE